MRWLSFCRSLFSSLLSFSLQYNEPTHVKTLKMSILPRIANAINAKEIVSELTEYISGGAGGGSGGVDADLARQAVKATGEIGCRVPQAADVVVESLLEALEMEAEYVRSATVMVMVDILRVYPQRATAVIPSLNRVLKRMEDASGRAAVVWMMGEYGHLIEDAPYLLEPLIDSLAAGVGVSSSSSSSSSISAYKAAGSSSGTGGGSVEAESDLVRNELLTATLKLFFKRPPEVQKMLGRLLKACLAAPPTDPVALAANAATGGAPPQSASASVRDRALLYYRLLRSNVGEASAVISGGSSGIGGGSDGKQPLAVSAFHDEQAPEVKASIWNEFNTLSVVYGKPASQFISGDHRIIPLDAALKEKQAKQQQASNNDDEGLLSQADSALPSYTEGGGAAAPASGSSVGGGAGSAPVADLLGADDLLGIGGGGGAYQPTPVPVAAPAPAPAAASSASGLLGLSSLYGPPTTTAAAAAPAPAAAGPTFRAGVTLDPGSYQSKWGAMPPSSVLQLRGGRPGVSITTGDIDMLLRNNSIYTIASGDVGASIKFYLFANDSATGSLHLWELLLDKASSTFAITQKSENVMAASTAAAGITAALRPLLAPGQ
jgi:Adaptin N terminal region/Beta2-adaptin appendage, C-terminal sub-domain